MPTPWSAQAYRHSSSDWSYHYQMTDDSTCGQRRNINPMNANLEWNALQTKENRWVSLLILKNLTNLGNISDIWKVRWESQSLTDACSKFDASLGRSLRTRVHKIATAENRAAKFVKSLKETLSRFARLYWNLIRWCTNEIAELCKSTTGQIHDGGRCTCSIFKSL